jgi:hypothetical protein
MSDSKLTYIYNSFDSIIDLLESGKPFDEIIEKVREFRDELPTTKEVIQEFLDNSKELEE